ncbi:HAMP domain-containing sensor histidine kinase [Xanthobacter autotrophicus]|uniref:sensor histidine kinase n=1 Tax=Xanthobacter autotrophicus TaxID=280 RepID=UPI003729CE87
MRSLRRHLLIWVMGALSIGAVCLLWIFYVHEVDELNDIFNENLKQIALSTASQVGFPSEDPPEPRILPRVMKVDPELSFVVQVFDHQGRPVFSSHPSPTLPGPRESGLREVNVDGQSWYVYSVVTESGSAVAARPTAQRSAASRHVALKLVVLLLALLAFIALLLHIAVRKGLRPLDDVTNQIGQRSAESLDPLPLSDFPREILPLACAVNDLMGRLGATLDVQRRFIADAAHELRTPISVLRLQLQLLRRAGTSARRLEAEQELALGIERAERLVVQLLDLSRVEPGTTSFAPVDLVEIASDVVATLSVMARARHINLGLRTCDAAVVDGSEAELRTLVANLVDNAIRYTPAEGRIQVTIARDETEVRLQVEDDGPGIPEAERERVFDRFYRVPLANAEGTAEIGSGIGLAVVKAAVEHHRGCIDLGEGLNGTGLSVAVALPAHLVNANCGRRHSLVRVR